GHLVDMEVLPAERERLAGPEAGEDGEPFVEELRAHVRIQLLAEVRVAGVALVADPGADDEPTARERINRQRFACDLPRASPRQGDDLDAEGHALRPHGDRCENDPRVAGRSRRIALVTDVVLEENAVPACLLGQHRELEEKRRVAAGAASGEGDPVLHADTLRAAESNAGRRGMAVEPGKIRNVAVVGHRGTGKTSIVEALLYQAGATNRLGTVESGSTVSDWDDDEQKRPMSLAATICQLEWQERKINLIDTPGDAGFQGDAIAALKIVEGALFAVSAVMGVEVQTSRQWQRAEEQGLSRVVFVNMLDRERADFFRALESLRSQLSDKCVAVHIPIGAEHELKGIVDLLHMKAYMDPAGQRESGPTDIPADMQDQVNEYREKLLDAVVETDEALMERYLEGQELSVDEVAHTLKEAVTRGEVFPVAWGVARKTLGTTGLLVLLVGGVPSPAKKGEPIEIPNTKTAAFVFKTIADPFAGRINVFRVLHGTIGGDA